MDLRGSQTGDVQTGDVAGRDVHHGADADGLLAFLRDYVFLDEQRREERQAHLDKRLDRILDEVRLYRRATAERLDVLAQWIRAIGVGLASVVVVVGLLVLRALLLDYGPPWLAWLPL